MRSGLNVKLNDWSYIALRVNGPEQKAIFYVDGETQEVPLGQKSLPATNADIVIGGGTKADPGDLNA